jgi:hypothetical protein
MNLQAAQKELHSKPPQVRLQALALEMVVVLSLSFVLVGIFA